MAKDQRDEFSGEKEEEEEKFGFAKNRLRRENKGRGSRTSLAQLCGPSGRLLVLTAQSLFSEAKFFSRFTRSQFFRAARESSCSYFVFGYLFLIYNV